MAANEKTAVPVAYMDLELPEGVTEIKPWAYKDGVDLRTVTVPATVIRIGEYAFHGCNYILRFDVSPNNPSYCTDKFGVLYSKDMKELIRFPAAARPDYSGNDDGMEVQWVYQIPEGVERIAPGACAGCRFIREFQLPQSLLELGELAFEGCDALEEVYITKNVARIGKDAFKDCPSFGPFYVQRDNPAYSNADCGALHTGDRKKLLRVGQGMSGELYLPEPLQQIEKGAFAGCGELETVYCCASVFPAVQKATWECTKRPKVKIL